ncbi:TRAP transporter permease [Natronomonas amylolytica]|uniref:TRAP transporter permease n=1 Tax=Natronomonas amylolytica TaxID=3108498 RepID=UPI003008AE20
MSQNDPPDDSRTPSADGGERDGSELDDGVATDASGEDADELLEEIEKKRSLRGRAAILVAAVAITFSAFQMWIAARSFVYPRPMLDFALTGGFPPVSIDFALEQGTLQRLQVNVIHVTFALVLSFLVYPTSTGDGFVSRRLGRACDGVRDRFEDASPVARATERVRGAVRWAALDHDRRRITPVDAALVLVALLPATHMVTQFTDIRIARQRATFEVGASLPELYPVLEPIAIGPLADTSWAFIVGVIGILLVLEATRRALGMLLMGLIIAFLLYARFGFLIPRGVPGVGVFAITDLGWARIVRNLWYNTESGINGTIVSVSVRFIYIFILFGAFLEMSGAGRWFIDLAYSLTGTRRGGPAKASVVSSGFMGMISGSSVANTVTTGAFTIPLMKESGYTPEFSGAVESSVSSGGQILPPVMGAAAFLIVEFTGTPFRQVIVAAALPALAFFFGMWVMVHFEAVRRGVGGLDRSDLLDIRPHFKRGWFYLVPIGLLLYFLIIARLTINRSGWYTIIATIVLVAVVAAYDRRIRGPFVGALLALFAGTALTQYLAGTTLTGYLFGDGGAGLGLSAALSAAVGAIAVPFLVFAVAVMLARPDSESGLLDLDPAVDETAENIDETLGRDLATTRFGRFGTFLLKSMDSGARTATLVVVAVAAAGVIPGVISVSGLGPNLTRLIILASGESFLLLLVLAGISAIILGMGMPTTVMYIILISVLGNALGTFGVALLAAHLFVLYLGLMADVTPPVMVAAYAAAGVANSDPFETGKLAFMLSLNKILVPFAFVFAPGILLIKDWDTEAGELTLVGPADILDLGFFVPEVLIPVVGLFAGVYAMGVTIIGYRSTKVSQLERVLYAVAGVLLMVPALFLSPVGFTAGLAGLGVDVLTSTSELVARGLGAALLAALVVADRRRRAEQAGTETGPETDAPAAPDA